MTAEPVDLLELGEHLGVETGATTNFLDGVDMDLAAMIEIGELTATALGADALGAAMTAVATTMETSTVSEGAAVGAELELIAEEPVGAMAESHNARDSDRYL